MLMAGYTRTERLIKEGRGQGTGKDYKPWIHVRDFSSQGKVSRIQGWKSGRAIQCLSSLETALARLLDWSDTVIDYYEQFPLLPLEETLVLAERLGIRVPIEDGEPRVRTTDFVVELQGQDGVVRQARSVKMATDLSIRSKVLGLELERQYWAARGIDWAIVTDREIPWDMVRNIEWLHAVRTLDDYGPIAALPLAEILPVLRKAIDDAETSPLSHVCLATDKHLGLEGGSCLVLVRHQLATKAWRTDMHRLIKTHEPLSLLPLASSDALEQVVA
jgi:hypothetical protein